METEDNISREEFTLPLLWAVSVMDEIIQKSAEVLYDKYLQSILPEHELGLVSGSLRHILRSNFVARDRGEDWHDEEDEEPTQPIVWAWANGGIPVEHKVVFDVPKEEDHMDNLK